MSVVEPHSISESLTLAEDGVTSGETVYKIAEKEEEATGLAALFSGLFTNRPKRKRDFHDGFPASFRKKEIDRIDG